MSPTPDRIAAIINADAPTNASEVRSLLGMAQYISHFIPNFSNIVAPLRRLTHQDAKFRWEKEHQKAFENLQESSAMCGQAMPSLQVYLRQCYFNYVQSFCV